MCGQSSLSGHSGFCGQCIRHLCNSHYRYNTSLCQCYMISIPVCVQKRLPSLAPLLQHSLQCLLQVSSFLSQSCLPACKFLHHQTTKNYVTLSDTTLFTWSYDNSLHSLQLSRKEQCRTRLTFNRPGDVPLNVHPFCWGEKTLFHSQYLNWIILWPQQKPGT